VSPLEIVLEFARAELTGDPYSFRFVPQDYVMRTPRGGFSSTNLAWSTDLIAKLHGVCATTPDANALAEIGDFLRIFLTPTGWEFYEQQISAAIQQQRPVRCTIRSSAAELFALPWELLRLRTTGQHLGGLPGVLVRYEWPETTTIPRDPSVTHQRIMVAWSAAGGAVPASEHVAAIRDTLDHNRGEPVVQSQVSPTRLAAALAAGDQEGHPFTILHLLCHGGARGSLFGLVLDDEDEQQTFLDPARLQQLVAPYASSLRLIVLSACDSGNQGNFGNPVGSIAQMLHRAGFAAVIASRYPLSAAGSVRMTEALYQSLLHERASMETAFLAARTALTADTNSLDWASLQLYSRAADHTGMAVDRTPPRGFISLDEHRDILVSREVLERAYDLPFHGRVAELARIREFVENSPKQVLLIHGPGGVGKSRLQYEAARGLRDEGRVEAVYCGTPHLEAGGDWDIGDASEINALAIFDDPKEPILIDRLLAALQGPWKRWKVILTVHTPKDPVLAALQDPRNRVSERPIELGPLSVADALTYSGSLLAAFDIPAEDRPRAERRLARACGYFPLWMTVATKLLETQEGDLNDIPEDHFKIAQRYLRDVLEHTRSEVGTSAQIKALLRWVALIQPINRQDEETLEYISAKAEFRNAGAVERAIEDLVQRRVASAYGVELRMVEIRPEVMRDHLLVEWLTSDVGSGRRRASMDAISLARSLGAEVRACRTSRRLERIVVTFLRVERLIEQSLPFLDPIVDAAVELAEAASDAGEQAQAIMAAQMFASRRPLELTRVATAICEREVPATDLRYHHTTREQTLALLPRALQDAARGCSTASERSAVLQGFIAMVDRDEVAVAVGARGGESASKLLGNTLHEYHGYRSSFRAEAGRLANEFLGRLAHGETPRESWRVIIEAMSALKRRDGYPSEDEPGSYISETRRIFLESDDGRIALSVREGLWALAMNSASGVTARTFAWSALHKIHGTLIESRGHSEWQELLADDLKRCFTAVSGIGVPVEDFQAARAIWHWHLKHEDQLELRQLAEKCELVYLRHPEIGRYAAIFMKTESVSHFEARVREFPENSPHSELALFFNGALAFTRGHAEKWRTQHVRIFASILGEERRRTATVDTFIRRETAQGVTSPLFDVALRMAGGALHGFRGDGDESRVAEVLEGLFAGALDARTRAEIISVLYIQAGRLFVERFGGADREFVLRHWDVVGTLPLKDRFSLIGRLLPSDPVLLGGLESELAELPPGDRADALGALWTGYYATLPYPLAGGAVSTAIVEKLRDLSACQPALECFDDNVVWTIRKLLKHVPKLSVRQLLDLVKARLFRFHERASDRPQNTYVRIFPSASSWVIEAVDTWAQGVPSAQQQQVLVELLDLVEHEAVIFEELAEFVVALDREGRAVPMLVASRLNATPVSSGLESVITWSRFAGYYHINGASWRLVAEPACRRAVGLSEDDAERVFASLCSVRTRFRGGPLDEQRERLRIQVDEAAKSMDEEKDPMLRRFWRWLNARALTILKQEEGLREEQRW